MQGTAVEKLSLLYVDDEAMLHEPFKLYMEMMFNFQVSIRPHQGMKLY